MIIIPWTQVGKERVPFICSDFSYLRAPHLLGEEWPSILTPEEAFCFFEMHHSRAALDSESNVLGGFGLRENFDETEIWLYYFLFPTAQGKGLGATLLFEAIKMASENKKHQWIYARCAQSNLRSIQVLAGAGFHECIDLRKGDHLIFCLALPS